MGFLAPYFCNMNMRAQSMPHCESIEGRGRSERWAERGSEKAREGEDSSPWRCAHQRVPEAVLGRARRVQVLELRGEAAAEEQARQAALGLRAGLDLIVNARVQPRHRAEDGGTQRLQVGEDRVV